MCVAETPLGVVTDRTHVRADPRPADHSAFHPDSTFADVLEQIHQVYLTSPQPALSQVDLRANIHIQGSPLLFLFMALIHSGL